MGRKATELGPLAVSRLASPGLHFVGGVAGLALKINERGARSWVLRIKVGDKRRDMGLGGFPDVPLAGARDAARAARAKVREGIDPVADGRAARSAIKASQAAAKTFKFCALAYIDAHEAVWRNEKHAQQWRNTLETYAYPLIGSLLVRDIGLSNILAVLEPIWKAKTETASRLRGRLEVILDWATTRGYRAGPNPARWKGHLDTVLPAAHSVANAGHHSALPFTKVGAFMTALRSQAGLSARALEFTILTASRSGEVRGASWKEIDRAGRMWTVPAERMKAGREHRMELNLPHFRRRFRFWSGAGLDQTELEGQRRDPSDREASATQQRRVFLDRSFSAAQSGQHVEIGACHGLVTGTGTQPRWPHALDDQHPPIGWHSNRATTQEGCAVFVIPVVQDALKHVAIGAGRNPFEEAAGLELAAFAKASRHGLPLCTVLRMGQVEHRSVQCVVSRQHGQHEVAMPAADIHRCACPSPPWPAHQFVEHQSRHATLGFVENTRRVGAFVEIGVRGVPRQLLARAQAGPDAVGQFAPHRPQRPTPPLRQGAQVGALAMGAQEPPCGRERKATLFAFGADAERAQGAQQPSQRIGIAAKRGGQVVCGSGSVDQGIGHAHLHGGMDRLGTPPADDVLHQARGGAVLAARVGP